VRFFVDLTLEGRAEPVTVLVEARDILAWESENATTWVQRDPTITDLAWLGWTAAVRRGEYTDSWKQFQADVIDLRDRLFRLEEVDPTPPAATDD
jgi:hypothetical protein